MRSGCRKGSGQKETPTYFEPCSTRVGVCFSSGLSGSTCLQLPGDQGISKGGSSTAAEAQGAPGDTRTRTSGLGLGTRPLSATMVLGLQRSVNQRKAALAYVTGAGGQTLLEPRPTPGKPVESLSGTIPPTPGREFGKASHAREQRHKGSGYLNQNGFGIPSQRFGHCLRGTRGQPKPEAPRRGL